MPFSDSSGVRQQRLPIPGLAGKCARGRWGDDSTLSFTFKDANRGALGKRASEAAARNETSGLWLHGYWRFDWCTYIKVSCISPNPVHDETDSSGAPVAYSVTGTSTRRDPWISGCRFYATNALSLLDQPGEYFVAKRQATSISFPHRDKCHLGCSRLYTWQCHLCKRLCSLTL